MDMMVIDGGVEEGNEDAFDESTTRHKSFEQAEML